MTKSQLQEQLERTERSYYQLYHQINELRNIIITGNRETDKPHLPSESLNIYERYNELLKKRLKKSQGQKLTFVTTRLIKQRKNVILRN